MLRELLGNSSTKDMVNRADFFGWTPLIGASYAGHLEAARVLVSAGADLDAQDRNGRTAMALAAAQGHAHLVEFLRERGAAPACVEASPRQPKDRGIRVLIIDDEPNVADNIKDILELHGYEVQSALDGIGGLELAHSFQPSIILVDMHMPRMDGLTFVRCMHATAWGKAPKVVALTGNQNSSALFSSVGVSGAFQKSVAPKDLLAFLDELARRVAERASMA